MCVCVCSVYVCVCTCVYVYVCMCVRVCVCGRRLAGPETSSSVLWAPSHRVTVSPPAHTLIHFLGCACARMTQTAMSVQLNAHCPRLGLQFAHRRDDMIWVLRTAQGRIQLAKRQLQWFQVERGGVNRERGQTPTEGGGAKGEHGPCSAYNLSELQTAFRIRALHQFPAKFLSQKVSLSCFILFS